MEQIVWGLECERKTAERQLRNEMAELAALQSERKLIQKHLSNATAKKNRAERLSRSLDEKTLKSVIRADVAQLAAVEALSVESSAQSRVLDSGQRRNDQVALVETMRLRMSI